MVLGVMTTSDTNHGVMVLHASIFTLVKAAGCEITTLLRNRGRMKLNLMKRKRQCTKL